MSFQAGQLIGQKFDGLNSDSDYVQSDQGYSDDEQVGQMQKDGELQSIFSNRMLSVRVTSANKQSKEVKQTSITLNLSKDKIGGENLETIKENVGLNTLRVDSNQQSKNESAKSKMLSAGQSTLHGSAKDKITLPT